MFVEYLREVWEILMELAPWLFLGAAIAALLKLLLPAGFISRHVGRPTIGSTTKAVLLGIPLPLCSCGVLPTAISLKKEGASEGAAVGFLISTPQTGVDSIAVTCSFLGWPIAVFKVIAAFLTGVIGGILVDLFNRGKVPPQDLASTMEGPANCDCQCSCDSEDEEPEYGGSRWKSSMRYALDDLLRGIYRCLVVGILIAAIIGVVVPPDYIAEYPALTGALGIIAILAIAVPLYVCSTGSVPIAASLIEAGMPIGSALVFLMAGPATNAATLGAVSRSFGRSITAIYLGVVLIGSVAFALVFQALMGNRLTDTVLSRDSDPSMWIELIQYGSAIILIALILRWTFLDIRIWRQRRRSKSALTGSHENIPPSHTCSDCADDVH